MSDLETVRKLLEKMNITYTTSKLLDTGLTQIVISDTPKITFTFFENGDACAIYNQW
jgi:hypothetical protein